MLKNKKPKNIRLISLNSWGGRALYPLMNFFRQHSDKADIFCLQEIFDADQKGLDRRHPDEHVHGDLFNKISGVLTDFEGSFAYFDDNPYRQSLAIFVRRNLPIKEISDFVVYKPIKPKETGSVVISSRKIQYLELSIPEKLTIANFHGLWNGGPKTDTPERISQSNRVKDFLNKIRGKKILCGDFNLLPETKSMKILNKGMINLIDKNKIPSTRTILYRHFDDPSEPNFADYILISPDVNVVRFEVLPDVVSDHSPLYLEFN
ncbi:MAG: endonuclease/exonuclease/phosphatase family protein [Patescibacteria group bacterium]|nr:endonuclease/exonuclease/phosphatase family protein [Patescibacteria group bacterium]